MKRLNLHLSDELHKRLKVYAVQAEKDMVEVVRKLIEGHLDKVEKKIKSK